MENINERVLAALHEEMEETYPMYDRETMERAARTYLDCVDREGFVFDFDLAWQWAGYSRKDAALRILKGTRGHLNLQEGVEYKIEKLYATGGIRKISGEVVPPTGGITNQRGKNGGDRKTEKIMLTAKGMNQFALAAHTPLGYCLRDVVLATSRILKHLMEEVQSGRMKIVRCNQGEERAVKRLKVCDTNKALMQEVSVRNPAYCGRVNGVTNKATTGRFKYETAKLLGKKPKEVNARDYMTPTQLAAAELIEILSRDEINNNPSQDSLVVHTDVANKVMYNIKDKVQGHIADEPLKLYNARRSMSIEDKKPAVIKQTITKVNTMNNYFASPNPRD